MRLKDKIALITGAGGGIGSATVKRFAEEGATVILRDINEKGCEKVLKEIEEKTKEKDAKPSSKEENMKESVLYSSQKSLYNLDIDMNAILPFMVQGSGFSFEYIFIDLIILDLHYLKHWEICFEDFLLELHLNGATRHPRRHRGWKGDSRGGMLKQFPTVQDLLCVDGV